MIRLAEFLPATPGPLWPLCQQMGVTRAIVKCAPELTGLPAPDDRDALRAIVARFEAHGFTVAGLEGNQFDMSRIKLGLPGRDEDLARYCQMLQNMAELGVPLLCYNFMVGTGWFRSGQRVGRGGAVATAFRAADAPESLPIGRVDADRVWENYTYFIKAVLPVAQRLGVRMALHPDDPPLPELSGAARVFGSVEAFDRAWEIFPTSSNAVTFCQANFKLMGCDLVAAARHFAGRIAFVHVRDVVGKASEFVEVFHDQTTISQADLFELYANELALDVPVRCDHVPTMAGDEYFGDHLAGYGTLGRLFAVGYFKGLLDARKVTYQ